MWLCCSLQESDGTFKFILNEQLAKRQDFGKIDDHINMASSAFS